MVEAAPVMPERIASATTAFPAGTLFVGTENLPISVPHSIK